MQERLGFAAGLPRPNRNARSLHTRGWREGEGGFWKRRAKAGALPERRAEHASAPAWQVPRWTPLFRQVQLPFCDASVVPCGSGSGEASCAVVRERHGLCPCTFSSFTTNLHQEFLTN